MILFFRCVAEAVAEKGMRGLAELIPGAAPIYDIAENAWKKYRECCREADQSLEIQRIAQAGAGEVKQAATEAAEQAAANQPELLPAIEMYLQQIPASVRQSLKRPEDPTGTTVPFAFQLRSVDDVVKLLPQALPRFRAGDPLPGKAGWVLDKQLGAGGFGEVWLARHPRFQSLVGAVKFCRNLQTRDRDMLHESRIIDRLLAQGSHANVVKLLDVHLDGEDPWLMYEYVEGGDLADLIHHWAGQPATARQAKAMAALQELAATIGHFHAQQPAIVHRDLKPANILKDTRGLLRVTDFGISGIAAQRMLENETRGLTTRGGRLQSYLYGSYTPLYASPQQRDGAPPDPRDDVHALGVIGYQMLTGQLSQGVGTDFVDDLKEAGVGDALIDLLRRCTAQKADRRPKDARELTDLLHAISQPPAPPPPAPPMQKPNAAPEALAAPLDDLHADEQNFLSFACLDKLDDYFDEHAASRLQRWKSAAESGVALGQFFYGYCLIAGKAIVEDVAAGAEWIRAAARQECALAQAIFGLMHSEGIGVPQDDEQAVSWLHLAADTGLAIAQRYLGNCYEEGVGVAQDSAQAAAWFEKSAHQGDVLAQVNLGRMYRDGRGVPKDELHAVRWFRKAAERDNASAQFWLGIMYQQGQGVPKDAKQAAAWFRKAAERGHASAQVCLGSLYDSGNGVPQDDTQAIAWYRKSAEQGNATAQSNLGQMYQEGQGVPQDDHQAVAWFRKAAEQGNDDAQNALGWIYQHGRGVPQDHREAVAWYKKAAEQGHAEAQFRLGSMVEVGLGADRDEAEAVEWYRKAADQGDADAQNALGVAYFNGQGIRQDRIQALDWLLKAADQGHAAAQSNLGTMFLDGRGVSQDDRQAVSWFRKAAEQGNAIAQNSLGVMYLAGRGVPKNDLEAFSWISKAAAQGHVAAQMHLGGMYAEGRGVRQDWSQAAACYRKAAEQGQVDAQFELGEAYWEGRGVAQDGSLALSWFRKAAAQGHVQAQFRLGMSYLKGGRVPKNEFEAITWIHKSAAQGLVDAQYQLGVMYADGDGTTRDEVQAMEWLGKAAAQGYAAAECRLGVLYAMGRGGRPDATLAIQWLRRAADRENAEAQRFLGKLYEEGSLVPQDLTQSLHWYRKAAHNGSQAGADAAKRISQHLHKPSPKSEEKEWGKAQHLNTIEAFEDYLDSFPDGPHALEARKKASTRLRKALLADLQNRSLRQRYLAVRSDECRRLDEHMHLGREQTWVVLGILGLSLLFGFSFFQTTYMRRDRGAILVSIIILVVGLLLGAIAYVAAGFGAERLKEVGRVLGPVARQHTKDLAKAREMYLGTDA